MRSWAKGKKLVPLIEYQKQLSEDRNKLMKDESLQEVHGHFNNGYLSCIFILFPQRLALSRCKECGMFNLDILQEND